MKTVPANRYVVFFSIAVVGCLADLATKSWVFGRLGMPGEQPIFWLWPDVFGLQTNLNEGGLFGMGQGRVVQFAAVSVIAAIGVLYWLFWVGAARDRLLNVALGCVTAGIFGNLFDRLGLPGLSWNYANSLHEVGEPVFAVRDWILVMIGRLPWPTFNIADSLLVCGACLLGIHALIDWRKERAAARNSKSVQS
ncbi:MAG: signal peptidase II [Planctomycetes bacterium]|nr:signal peptidase II [Planctomycetota bacterium]